MHEKTKDNITRMNVKYKLASDKDRKSVVFELGDLVWLRRISKFEILLGRR